MLMMDKNNGQVADLIQKVARGQGLGRLGSALFENIDAAQRGLQASHGIFLGFRELPDYGLAPLSKGL